MDYSKGSYCCRICLAEQEYEHVPCLLISPCSCTGTQKHIHLKCLRKWQENVQKHDAADERAFRCSVCRSFFSKEYLPPKSKVTARLRNALRGVGGALCITLLAFGLSGPPWPHLALLVLLLLGTRSSSLLALALLLMGSLLAAMHARGLRVIMRMDGAGRLGLAVIRHGAPLPGLGPGTLLVASEGLDNTMFRHCVVLLYEQGRAGAKGVILTQTLNAPPNNAAFASPSQHRSPRQAATSEDTSSDGSGQSEIGIRHFLGGPVGMPGEGVRQEVLLLHTVDGVPGSNRVPLAPLVSPHHGGTSRTALRDQVPSTLIRKPAADSSVAGGDVGSAGAVPISAAAIVVDASAGESSSAAKDSQESLVAVTAHLEASSTSSPAPTSVSTAQSGRTAQAVGSADSNASVSGTSAAAGSSDPEEGGEGACSSSSSLCRTGGDAHRWGELFWGGALSDVLEKAADPDGGPVRWVNVYHGVCSWAEGQLEGEIRSGAWVYAPATLQDFVWAANRSPSQIWAELYASYRMIRPQR